MRAACLALALMLALPSSANAAPVDFRAAIVKRDGSVKPVARGHFLFFPHNGLDTESDYINAGALLGLNQPIPLSYYRAIDLYEGLVEHGYYDIPIFNRDYQRWIMTIQDSTKDESSQPRTVSIKTNLDGRAVLDLDPGDWVVMGKYSERSILKLWYQKVSVTPGINNIELTNDGTDGSIWFPKAPTLENQPARVTELGKKYAESARQTILSSYRAFKDKPGVKPMGSVGQFGFGGNSGVGSYRGGDPDPVQFVVGASMTASAIYGWWWWIFPFRSTLEGCYYGVSDVDYWDEAMRLHSLPDAALIEAISIRYPAIDKSLREALRKQ